MGFKGYRKLVDVPVDRAHVGAAIRGQLRDHRIAYRTSWHGTGESAFRRVYVEPENLCCSMSIVLAVEATTTNRRHNPLDSLPFPVLCRYPGCGAGPFTDAVQVDEHITEEHLPQAVWTFALEKMLP